MAAMLLGWLGASMILGLDVGKKKLPDTVGEFGWVVDRPGFRFSGYTSLPRIGPTDLRREFANSIRPFSRRRSLGS
jgi:hypothetical protein